MTQADLAARAGVALMTVRELQNNLQPRRRNPRTLAAVSEALGWPGDQLARILEGQPATDVDQDDPVLGWCATGCRSRGFRTRTGRRCAAPWPVGLSSRSR